MLSPRGQQYSALSSLRHELFESNDYKSCDPSPCAAPSSDTGAIYNLTMNVRVELSAYEACVFWMDRLSTIVVRTDKLKGFEAGGFEPYVCGFAVFPGSYSHVHPTQLGNCWDSPVKVGHGVPNDCNGADVGLREMIFSSQADPRFAAVLGFAGNLLNFRWEYGVSNNFGMPWPGLGSVPLSRVEEIFSLPYRTFPTFGVS